MNHQNNATISVDKKDMDFIKFEKIIHNGNIIHFFSNYLDVYKEDILEESFLDTYA